MHNKSVVSAVVVGLCAHGLAMARSLAKAGVEVLGLEADERLPGFFTIHAEVVRARDINGEGLIEELLALASARSLHGAVLYLTNDNMVRVVARNWPRLEAHYRLSWSNCRDEVLRLLDKSSLADHCAARQLNYPGSLLLESEHDLAHPWFGTMQFPLIVKPAVTLSGFKVRLVSSKEEIRGLMQTFPSAFPLLVQQWIPGDDRAIRFAAVYLKEGRIMSSFVGRKLRANPPAMGQAVIAEPFFDQSVLDAASRFFSDTRMSGPSALEVKMAPDGQAWVIEPNVGRTEYLVDVCIANGVNFPVIEYMDQTDQPLEPAEQRREFIWFDNDRSPGSYAKFWLTQRGTIEPGWKGIFPYGDAQDVEAVRRARRKVVKALISRLVGKLTR